jgi:hypothetical protein
MKNDWKNLILRNSVLYCLLSGLLRSQLPNICPVGATRYSGHSGCYNHRPAHLAQPPILERNIL